MHTQNPKNISHNVLDIYHKRKKQFLTFNNKNNIVKETHNFKYCKTTPLCEQLKPRNLRATHTRKTKPRATI